MSFVIPLSKLLNFAPAHSQFVFSKNKKLCEYGIRSGDCANPIRLKKRVSLGPLVDVKEFIKKYNSSFEEN